MNSVVEFVFIDKGFVADLWHVFHVHGVSFFVGKRNLAVGSFVWLFNPAKTKGRSPKLSIKWMGPYLVREKIGVLCKIQLSPKSRTRVVHQDRLLAYTGQPRQSWIVQ